MCGQHGANMCCCACAAVSSSPSCALLEANATVSPAAWGYSSRLQLQNNYRHGLAGAKREKLEKYTIRAGIDTFVILCCARRLPLPQWLAVQKHIRISSPEWPPQVHRRASALKTPANSPLGNVYRIGHAKYINLSGPCILCSFCFNDAAMVDVDNQHSFAELGNVAHGAAHKLPQKRARVVHETHLCGGCVWVCLPANELASRRASSQQLCYRYF